MMVPGKQYSLTVLRDAPPGLYLDGLNLGEILLPGKQAPEGTAPGDIVKVFVHHDSEDRLVATTKTPIAQLGEVAGFQVVGVRPGIGAFLDWGLDKDLLLPLREQTHNPLVGDWVVAVVLLDQISGRLIASARLLRHIHKTPPSFQNGQSVGLVIVEETDLGYKAVVEHSHWGLIYKSSVATPLVPGDELEGFIREVRPDGKIDLSLDAAGYQRIAPLTTVILNALKNAGGSLPLDDKSSPESVRDAFGCSKKAFKQAIGSLLRARKLKFIEGGIALDAEP